MKKRIDIEKASRAQLAKYVTEYLGIDAGDESEADLRAQIRIAQPGSDTIMIDVEDEADAAAVTPKPAQPRRSAKEAAGADRPNISNRHEFTGRFDRKYRIRIPNQQGAAGTQPVWVAVNGTGMWIPRERDEVVPARYIEALNRAVRIEYDQDEALNMIPREVREYPFQILGEVESEAA